MAPHVNPSIVSTVLISTMLIFLAFLHIRHSLGKHELPPHRRRDVLREYGPNVARLALDFPLTSYLCLTLLSYGAFYNGDCELAVLFTAISFFPFNFLV